MAISKIGTTALSDDSVTADKVANNAITTDMIAGGEVGVTDLANGSITDAKISATAAIANSKIDLSSVTQAIATAGYAITSANSSGNAALILKRSNSNTTGAYGQLGWQSSAGYYVGSIAAVGVDNSNNKGKLQFRTHNGSANETDPYSLTTLALELGHDGAATFSGNVTVKSGNKLIINRTDNATGGEITYGPSAGTGFTFNDANADGIDFKTGSTMLMSIDSTNQRVGIGSDSINELLHLKKSSGTTLVKTEVAANSTVGFEIKKTNTTTSNWRIVDGQTVNGQLEVYDVTNSRKVMGFDQNGNVGIGVTAVDSSGFGRALDVSSNTGAGLYLRDAGDSTYGAIGMFNSSLSINAKASAGKIVFYSNNSPKAEIGSDGNMLIGTQTTGAIRLNSETNLNGNLAAQFKNTHSTGSYGIKVMGGHDSSNYSAIFTDKDNTTLLKITGSGEIGIGSNEAHLYHSAAKDLVIAGGGSQGITIKSGTSNSGNIFFADGNSGNTAYRGYIQYQHGAPDTMVFGTAADDRLGIDGNGALKLFNGSNAGWIDFDGTSLQLNTQRNPNTGAFVNTSKAHAGITLNDGNGTGDSSIKFYTASSNNTTGTLRAQIDHDGVAHFNGDVKVLSGDVIMGNGRGINFTATSNSAGSMSSETLNDYEEGTWTPTLIAGTTNPTGGGALAPSGTYTKIGNRVWLTFYVGRSWTNSPSGGVFLANLPFTVHSTSPNAYFATVTTYKVDFGSANIPFLIPSGGQTNAALYTAASGGTWSALTWQSHMTSSAGSYITGTIHYVVA